MKKYPEIEWTPKLISKFWDYESNFPERYFTNHNGDELLRQIAPYLENSRTILDYGCGTGNLLKKLLDHGYFAGGLDFSEHSTAIVTNQFRARKNFLGAFQPHQLTKQGKKFDAILVIEVVEHLYDAPLNESLNVIKQILQPDGVCIFTTPNEERLEDSQVFCPCCEKTFHRWQHVRNWSQQSLSQYLVQQGFSIVDSFTTSFHQRKQERKRKWATLKKIKLLFQQAISGPKPQKKQRNLAIVCRPSRSEP